MYLQGYHVITQQQDLLLMQILQYDEYVISLQYSKQLYYDPSNMLQQHPQCVHRDCC